MGYNEQRRKNYQYYKSRGICVKCGKDVAMEGMVVCPECGYKDMLRSYKYRNNMNEEQRNRIREWRNNKRSKNRTDGLCSCGKPRDNEKYKLCKDCRAYHRNYKRKKSHPNMWMELGLCRWCGGEVVEGYKYCAEHLEKIRAQTEKNFRPNGVNIANHDWFRRANHAFWEEKRTAN